MSTIKEFFAQNANLTKKEARAKWKSLKDSSLDNQRYFELYMVKSGEYALEAAESFLEKHEAHVFANQEVNADA